MSKIQKNAQPKKPLGGGEKAEAKGDNRILYILLLILIGVFIWKVADQDAVTDSILDEESNSVDHLFDKEVESETPNPNVEVEIVEADFNTANATTKENDNTNIAVVVEEEVSGTEAYAPVVEENTYVNTSEDYSNSTSSPYENTNSTENDYGYIYATSVEIPQGTYNGLDENGFAKVSNQVDINVAVSQFDGSTGRLVEVPDNQLNSNHYNNEPEILPTFNPPVEREVTYATTVDNNDDAERYPTTGIDYGTDAYPLRDTLPWHPYESLAYIREEKEVFVAEKVRNMPTADDLEPNIPPSTLGDRDTRMGFGVVIRPNR